MTITTETNTIAYNGDGVNTGFPFPFKVAKNVDLQVYVDDVLVEENDLVYPHTITGIGDAAGGDVTFTLNPPPSGGANVLLARVVAATQEVDYIPYDAFPAETHEGALDKLTMLVQQVQDSSDRALRFPLADPSDPVLPDVANRANMFLAFDASGVPAAIPGTGSGVNIVSGATPITSTGGLAPVIGIDAATTSSSGSQGAVDKAKVDSLNPVVVSTLGVGLDGVGGAGQTITLAAGATFILPQGNHLIDFLATSTMRLEYATNSSGILGFDYPLTIDIAEKVIRVYSDGEWVRVHNIGGSTEIISWASFKG